MKENLIYLFASGVILGAGPCLSFCAPILISYFAVHRTTIKQSAIAYTIFSLGKLASYLFLGVFFTLGKEAIKTHLLNEQLKYVQLILGFFIVLIGLSMLIFSQKTKINKLCALINQGNIRNVGVLGILLGLSPCFALIAILDYIVIISHSVASALIFSFAFGLGTIFSPLALLVIISAKLANKFSQNNKVKLAIRLISGALLIFLGVKVIQ